MAPATLTLSIVGFERASTVALTPLLLPRRSTVDPLILALTVLRTVFKATATPAPTAPALALLLAFTLVATETPMA